MLLMENGSNEQTCNPVIMTMGTAESVFCRRSLMFQIEFQLEYSQAR